ncbi:TetR/AcrR family transcriptional regulator [Jatrophihabitans sp. DSM 45814]
MPKVTQQYRDARREHILSAARRCFLRDGFHATSMQDLFIEAGLSSGAVYRYFASKDDMIIAIAEENMQDVVAMIHAITSQQPRGSLGAAMAEVLSVVQTKHSSDGLGGLAILVWAEALRNPSLADEFNALLRQLKAAVADLVAVHQRSGHLPADVTADALATVLMSIMPGYLLQLSLLGPDSVEGATEAVRALWPDAVG